MSKPKKPKPTELSQCKYCGRELPRTHHICSECGKKLKLIRQCGIWRASSDKK